jgi:hypothetical protein
MEEASFRPGIVLFVSFWNCDCHIGIFLGGVVGLFVLIAVGVVVAQTWLDWRDSRKSLVVPDWVKGLALGGAITACLTATASYASVWLQDPASSWSAAPMPRMFWPELGFLALIMGIIVVAARKKRMRLALLLVGVVVVAYCLGMALSS